MASTCTFLSPLLPPYSSRPFTVVFPEVVLARPNLLIESYHKGLPIAVLLSSSFDSNQPRITAGPAPVVSAPEAAERGATTATAGAAVAAGERLLEVSSVQGANVEREAAPASIAQVSARRMYKDKVPKNVSRVFLEHVLAMDDEETAELKRQVAACGLDAFLRMLFEHGFFHADLHPGNIIVDLGSSVKPNNGNANNNNNTSQSQRRRVYQTRTEKFFSTVNQYLASILAENSYGPLPSVFGILHPDDPNAHPGYTYPEATSPAARHIIFIDAGMSTKLTAQDRKNINDLFYFVGSGQGELAAQMLIDRSRHDSRMPEHTPEERAGFIKEVGDVVNQAAAVGFNLSSMSVVSTLTALLSAARNYRVKLDTSFISVVVGE